jgi:hypothetical protein
MGPFVDDIICDDCGNQPDGLSCSFAHCIAFLSEDCYNVSKDILKGETYGFSVSIAASRTLETVVHGIAGSSAVLQRFLLHGG